MKFLVVMVTAALLLSVVGTAWSLVSIDPKLADELRAKGALEPLMRQLQDARDRGFFDLDNPIEMTPGKMTTWHVLVILADFDDENNSGFYEASDYDDRLFAQTTEHRSMTDHYIDNSFGDFLITGDVVGWYRMPHDRSYYSNADGITGTPDDHGFGVAPQSARGMVQDAIDAADPDVNFNDYTNGQGRVNGLFVVHAGAGAEETGEADDIWSHRSSVNYLTDDGVQVGSYTTEPEYRGGFMLTDMGVFAHEFGHVLGLPDLYDTDGSSSGIGRWGLMAGGSWNGGGHHPAYFSAWSRVQLGMIVPQDLTEEADDVVLPPSEEAPVIYRIQTAQHGPNEYLLLENRQNWWNDTWLPGNGLLVWHVDDSRGSNRDEACEPTDPLHPLVRLIQADGACGLEGGSGGDSADPFPGSTDNLRLGSVTVPNSRAYGGEKTNIVLNRIREIDEDMYFDLRFSDILINLVPDDFALIEEALSVVGPGDEIRIAGGQTFLGAFDVVPGVKLTGGWDPTFTVQDPSNPSVLESDRADAVLKFEPGPELVELQDLVIRNGQGFHRFFPDVGYYGGGVHMEDASAHFTRVRFENNEAGDMTDDVSLGGAIAGLNSSIVLDDCTFAANASLEGGEIFLSGGSLTASSTVFEGSTLFVSLLGGAQRGGTVLAENADVSVDACEFYAYDGATQGGALYLQGGTLDVQNSTFVDAAATGGGGAIYVLGTPTTIADTDLSGGDSGGGAALFASAALVQWQGGTVDGNHSTGLGGALRLEDPAAGSYLRGLLITGNTADLIGGALSVQGGALVVEQCVLHQNVGGFAGGALHADAADLQAHNNIFSENSVGAVWLGQNGTVSLDYNLYWGTTGGDDVTGSVPGANAVFADPRFVNPANAEFHLGPGSLAIDAGDPSSPQDFDGSTADLGLYAGVVDDGLRPSAPQSPAAAPAGGDVLISWAAPALGTTSTRVDVYARPIGDIGPGVLLGSSPAPGLDFTHVSPGSAHEYVLQAVDVDEHAGSPTGWFSPDATPTPALPGRFAVGQPYPNPFNPTTTLQFDLSRAGRVRVEIIDVAGRRVALVADQMYPAGQHHLRWRGLDSSGRRVASGVYHLRLQSDEGTVTRRLMLLK